MTWLALPWFVLVTSGSATRMTFVVAAELVGLASLGLPGGRLLGRFGAWRTMLASDAARGPLMLVVPVLHWSGHLSFAALLALAYALGALAGPYFAAQKMIVPELLGEDEALVGRANALFQGATRVTLLLGPVLAGVLISVLSAPAVLVVDGATYLVSVALVGGLVPRPQPVAPDEDQRGFRRAIAFVVRDPLLRVWTPVFALGDAAWTAFFVAVPFLVVTRFDADPRVAGLLLASFGAGAVAGNVVAYRVLVERVPALLVVARGVLGQALPLWLLVVHLPAWTYALALVLSGFANGIVNPSIHALMTLRVPPALRPTVMTNMVVLYGLVQPLGLFAVGPVLDAFGTEPVFVAFAAVQTLAMASVAAVSLAVQARPAAALTPGGA